jgi:hypothetical protein
MGGHRQTYRYLTVVLLAQLTAILAGYTDRVAALFRKAGVIDDPGLDWLVSGDRWQYPLTHTGQYCLIRPGCLRHKMQQRLVLRRSSLGRSHRRQWFDALAALGAQQPDTIVREWSDPVGMAQCRCQVCRVGAEPCFRPRPIVKIHPTPPGRFESPLLPNRNRVVPSAICLIIIVFLRLSRIKRQVRPMMGFKSFWSAAATPAGIELMHMIRKRQLKAAGRLCPAQQFYSLAS